MAAAMVFMLRGIAETIETTTTAWENRDYYVKADRFRMEWEWAAPAAKQLKGADHPGSLGTTPGALAALAPHFADIRIAKMTRPDSAWKSSYQQLLQEAQPKRES